MAHLLAKPAEMRRDEEVGVNAGRRADRARIEKAPDAPDIGDVAPVLHDGMDTACLPGALDDGARVFRAVGERLFGQQMAMMRERRERHLASRGGHDDVEHCLGLGLVENGIEVRADGDAIELVFARPRPGPVGVEIDEADDGYFGNLSGGIEPGFAHGSAADQDDIHHPSAPPARPLQAGIHGFVTFSVNVYDNTPDGVECQSAFCRL